MIDHQSEPGSWAKALRYSTIRPVEFTTSRLEAELDAKLARRKAIRIAYSSAQVRG